MNPDFIPLDQLAARWGCSKRFIQDEIRRGNLTAVKLGRRLMFDPADVQAYVDAHRTTTAAGPRRTRRPRARAAS